MMMARGLGRGITTGDGQAVVSGLTQGVTSVGAGVGHGVESVVTGTAEGVFSVGQGLFSGVKVRPCQVKAFDFGGFVFEAMRPSTSRLSF